MADISENRVAVYIDFDNIVISRYDEVHGKGRFTKDRVREHTRDGSDELVAARLKEAAVDLGAIIDYASSFGTLVLTRAYADWSQTVNAEYRGQLVGRAVDLVQLFPAAAYGKNGADIRLAVDAIEDMFRLPDLTHVVIVAGDSDYIALAQRAKRLGRYVVAVGVAGSISRSLAAACDRMVRYDALAGVAPGEAVDVSPEVVPDAPSKPTRRRGTARSRTTSAAGEAVEPETTAAVAADDEPAVSDGPAGEESSGDASPHGEPSGEPAAASQTAAQEPAPKAKNKKLTDKQTQQRAGAGQLLQRALRLAHDKDEDAEWLDSSSVKNQLLRMDPAFNEKELGYASFSDFANSFKFVELDATQQVRRIRLRRR
jgi:uncharacterized LabA/DUF88 family protein